MAAIEESAPAPVISAALYDRFSSRGEADFADKLLSAMRHEFGGHVEKADAPQGGPRMNAPPSDAIVFFGATGDLAYKKIFPALQAMIRRGHLDVPVIGVAQSGWDLEQLKTRAKDSLEKHGTLDPAAFAKLCSLLRYIDGDYRNPATFTQLRQALGGVQRPLHYLAIPPSMFATVTEGLAQAGCAKDARVVVEKPFGRDLASAQELNRTLHRFFPESSIFRIDHYLGKEAVLNLIYFRFANPLIEAGWNSEHLESIQITMAEKFRRGRPRQVVRRGGGHPGRGAEPHAPGSRLPGYGMSFQQRPRGRARRTRAIAPSGADARPNRHRARPVPWLPPGTRRRS